MCNIEFPHFGASYPDAHCINGYLWDMDSYENGCYTIGGDDPCPFCNTETWLKTVLDNEEFASREDALEWVEKMREKWGAEHRGCSEIPNDLEEAADEYEKANTGIYPEVGQTSIRDAFVDGAKWQKEHEPTKPSIMESFAKSFLEIGARHNFGFGLSFEQNKYNEDGSR